MIYSCNVCKLCVWNIFCIMSIHFFAKFGFTLSLFHFCEIQIYFIHRFICFIYDHKTNKWKATECKTPSNFSKQSNVTVKSTTEHKSSKRIKAREKLESKMQTNCEGGICWRTELHTSLKIACYVWTEDSKRETINSTKK